MKLRNKKTSEIVEATDFNIISEYNSLAELNKEWEDMPEEPKEHWCITMYGGITRIKDDEEPIDDLIEIGNYFNSKEDAYDAWDKLKAWKRLKDCGFKFKDFARLNDQAYLIRATSNESWTNLYDDLELLFGGEE